MFLIFIENPSVHNIILLYILPPGKVQCIFDQTFLIINAFNVNEDKDNQSTVGAIQTQ